MISHIAARGVFSPRLVAAPPRFAAGAQATSAGASPLTQAFDNKFYRPDELPYFRIRFEPITWNLPAGTDVAAAWDVFYRWAHRMEKHETTLNGERLLVIRWTADNASAGGVELFDSSGRRVASQGWGAAGPTKTWTLGPNSPWYDKAKADLDARHRR